MCVIQMATLFVLDALRAYLPVGCVERWCHVQAPSHFISITTCIAGACVRPWDQ